MDIGSPLAPATENRLISRSGPGLDLDVCQVNATSPLLKAETIKGFVDTMIEGGYDSFFATEEVRAESFYKGDPFTFSTKFKRPSNELEPIQVVCWAIAGWRREAFIAAYERDDVNEDGPVFAGKQGVFPIDEREALDLVTRISHLKHLCLKGLMSMPPFFDAPEKARPYFRQLSRLRDRIIAHNIPGICMDEISMGMTGDFEVAIEEGATLVRIGTAIFGARQ